MALAKTKTFWLGIANIIGGIGCLFGQEYGCDPTWGWGLIDFGLVLIFGRHALEKIELAARKK